jgi:hypothetical protein
VAAADLTDATLREVNIGGADLSPRFRTSKSALHIAQPPFPELPPYDFKPVRAFQEATAHLFKTLGLTPEIETTLDHVWQQTYALASDDGMGIDSEIVLSSTQAKKLFEYIRFYLRDDFSPLEERPPSFPNSPVDADEIHEVITDLARAWRELVFVGSENDREEPNLVGFVGPVVLAATPPNSSVRATVGMLNPYEMDQLRGKSSEQREENINAFVDTYTAKATR